MTYAEKMERLRELGDLQGEMADKAARYAAHGDGRPELAMRFERASYAAVNARVLMQAALMAEREAGVPYGDCAPASCLEGGEWPAERANSGADNTPRRAA